MNSNAGGRNRKKQRDAKGGQGRYTGKLRLAEEGEMYACVEKMVGNGRVAVVGADGKPYHCVIRQKFKGRHKQDNMMCAGTWCLVGVRDWESRQNGIAVCDLLHVCRDTDVSAIKKKETVNLAALISTEDAAKNSVHADAVSGDGIVFTHDVEDENVQQEREERLLGGVSVGGAEEQLIGQDDEINFDDI
jgi:hypothetical protein